jgi:predicted cobalt transporter CbtA
VFSSELFRLIKQVVFSWQVIGVTVVLIVYLTLVFYVARLYHKPKRYGFSSPKKSGKKAETAPAAPVQVTGDEEDLGLEEG